MRNLSCSALRAGTRNPHPHATGVAAIEVSAAEVAAAEAAAIKISAAEEAPAAAEHRAENEPGQATQHRLAPVGVCLSSPPRLLRWRRLLLVRIGRTALRARRTEEAIAALLAEARRGRVHGAAARAEDLIVHAYT